MIKSFKCKETENIFKGLKSSKFPSDIHKRAFNKLSAIHVSVTIEDLRAQPSNHLEKLKRARSGQYSILINDTFRVCFKWHEGNAYDVEIDEYQG